MKTLSSLIRKMQIAFGTAALTLLLVGAMSYYGLVQSSESNLWARHTHEVLESIQSLRFDPASIGSSVKLPQRR
jgi:CHASE3 domain sensor protein